MKRSKRWIGAAFALLCMLSFLPAAHAEEVKVGITAAPSELADSGTVVFSFEIANYNTEYPLIDLAITYLGTRYDNVTNGQEVPPSGSVRDIQLTLPVSEGQLDSPITFTITWTRNGEPMSQDAAITIRRAADPVIAVTRTADKTMARPGEDVTLTYTIRNDTKFDMTDITLIDENVSDNPVLKLAILQASGTYTINHVYKMGEESVTSAPFATYTVNGKTKSFSAVEPAELTMVRIELDMRVAMGTPTPQGVAFTFDIQNTGTQTISNIAITDERANPVNEAAFSLEPDETHTLTYSITPSMTEPLRNVKFALVGVDPFGEAYSLAPETTYEVYPFVDDSQISVSMRAETVTAWSSESGSLTARVIVTNHSTVALTGVSVLESTIGVVKTLETLPAGETTFDLAIALGSPRNLSFTVKGYDPTGVNRELSACMLPVAYGTATPSPETTPEPAQEQGGNMTLFAAFNSVISRVLLAMGVLLVLSFAVLIVLTFLERKRSPFFEEVDEDDAEAFDDELDDAFEEAFRPREPHKRKHVPIEYDDEPSEEEISYTKRMLAIQQREQEQQAQKASEPIRLPPPHEPEPVEEEMPAPRRNVIELPASQEPAAPAKAAETTQRFAPVRAPEIQQTQPRSQSDARVLPEYEADAPQMRLSTPKVYEYRRMPRTLPIKQKGVVRVRPTDKKE